MERCYWDMIRAGASGGQFDSEEFVEYQAKNEEDRLLKENLSRKNRPSRIGSGGADRDYSREENKGETGRRA